ERVGQGALEGVVIQVRPDRRQRLAHVHAHHVADPLAFALEGLGHRGQDEKTGDSKTQRDSATHRFGHGGLRLERGRRRAALQRYCRGISCRGQSRPGPLHRPLQTIAVNPTVGAAMGRALPSSRKSVDAALDGKVVVVTGGSAGVGRATALLFAEKGARVALIARDEAGLEGARAEIEAAGGEAAVFPADVADADAVSAAAQACAQQLGPVDIWVNNAMATVFSPVHALGADEIRRVTDVTY